MTPSPQGMLIAGAEGRSTTARLLATLLAGHAGAALDPVVIVLSRGNTRGAEGQAPVSWSEALSGLTPAGLAIVTADDARLVAAARATGVRVVTVGRGPDAALRAQHAVTAAAGLSFELSGMGDPLVVQTQLLGEHLLTPVLAAIAAAEAAGVARAQVVAALEGIPAAGPATMEPLRHPSGVLVIDDTVSASPAAMEGALKTLAMIGTEGHRTIAVLGQLDELPEGGLDRAGVDRERHDRVGRLAVRYNVAQLVVVGDDARHIHNAAGLEGSWNGESVLLASADEAYDRLRDKLRSGDVVLVKSSSTAGLSGLAARLAAAGAAS